jgi:multiple sugar transport system ATP-binding protein
MREPCILSSAPRHRGAVMAEIRLEDVWKVYGDGTQAVRALDLDIADGEFMVLVGPSGCGKTTALRMVAGLEEISAGAVRIGDRVVNDVHPRDRDIAMVFQNYALYPHLTVAENIGFGLRLRKVPKREVRQRVERVARLLGIDELLDRRPRALSGGQRQRVAMGRAIVREPAAFLMDEPLSNLDAKLRVQTRAEILRLQKDLRVTTLYVTHDQVEAMTMGDRVAVMRRGVLQQVAPPDELYERPVNLFVAGFIGSPAMNVARGRLEQAGEADGDRPDSTVLRLGSITLALDPDALDRRPALRAHIGRDVIVGFRPEDMEDATLLGDTDRRQCIDAEADLVEKLGSEILIHFRLDVPPVDPEHAEQLAEATEVDAPPIGDSERPEFVARVSPRSRITERQHVRLVVDVARAHFFDPATGEAILQPAEPVHAGTTPIRGATSEGVSA